MSADEPDPSQENEEALKKLKERFEFLRDRMNAARIAYLHRTQFDGRVIEYDDLKSIVQQVIDANYELQRARYGEVRLKLSVAKLLRRGR